MTRIYTGNRIHDGQASIIVNARLDLATYEEGFNTMPPAMFSNWADLQSWACRNGLKLKFIDNSKDNIVLITGEFNCGNYRIPYRQLWAKAAYKPYRNPWITFHEKADKLSRPRFSTLHADHVISKGRVLYNNPDAWVMLFPVPGGSNSPFGSLVEKKLAKLPPIGSSGYSIDGLVGFKIFSSEYPRTASELQEQLKAIGGQVSSNFHELVTSAIIQVWKPKTVLQKKKAVSPRKRK